VLNEIPPLINAIRIDNINYVTLHDAANSCTIFIESAAAAPQTTSTNIWQNKGKIRSHLQPQVQRIHYDSLLTTDIISFRHESCRKSMRRGQTSVIRLNYTTQTSSDVWRLIFLLLSH